MTLEEKFYECLGSWFVNDDDQFNSGSDDLVKIASEGKEVIAEGTATFIGGIAEYCIQNGDKLIRVGSLFYNSSIKDIEGKKVRITLEVIHDELYND